MTNLQRLTGQWTALVPSVYRPQCPLLQSLNLVWLFSPFLSLKVQIVHKKIDLSNVQSKCGSKDNIRHKPGTNYLEGLCFTSLLRERTYIPGSYVPALYGAEEHRTL